MKATVLFKSIEKDFMVIFICLNREWENNDEKDPPRLLFVLCCVKICIQNILYKRLHVFKDIYYCLKEIIKELKN